MSNAVQGDELVEQLRVIWQELLPDARIDVDSELPNLGSQSINVIKIAVRLQETFGIDVPLEVVLESLTLSAVADVITSLRRERARS